jgi:flavin reductase (DIM6/NTAB) family NADH-FMN oxidoreductase RutF
LIKISSWSVELPPGIPTNRKAYDKIRVFRLSRDTLNTSPSVADAFRQACSRYATGVTVVTTFDADGLPQGMTANSFTSVSLQPPLISVCVAHAANMYPHFRNARTFAINILAGSQQEYSVRFSQWDPQERFEGILWTTGDIGAPLLEGALAHLECTVWKKVEAGDHTILIGRVRRAFFGDGAPLVYFDRGYRKLADF